MDLIRISVKITLELLWGENKNSLIDISTSYKFQNGVDSHTLKDQLACSDSARSAIKSK